MSIPDPNPDDLIAEMMNTPPPWDPASDPEYLRTGRRPDDPLRHLDQQATDVFDRLAAAEAFIGFTEAEAKSVYHRALLEQLPGVGSDNRDVIQAARDVWAWKYDPERMGASDPDPVTGIDFITDNPTDVPAVWGRDEQVAWAEGEPLMIFGPTGTGKTTLCGQLIRSLLLTGDPVIGLDCPQQPDATVLYFAMDRPRQATRSLRRQFSDDELEKVNGRLKFWRGPLPASPSKDPKVLLRAADRHRADIIFVDSVKDLAGKLSDDESGSAINRAVQYVIASGREVTLQHHPRKTGTGDNAKAVKTVDDVYGSGLITAGCGSVLALNGSAGGHVLRLEHLKQPADVIDPMKVRHDKYHGRFEREGHDLYGWLRSHGFNGTTAQAAAAWITSQEDPDRADVEKARRRLDQFVADGTAQRTDGTKGGTDGGTPARWYAIDS